MVFDTHFVVPILNIKHVKFCEKRWIGENCSETEIADGRELTLEEVRTVRAGDGVR